MFPWMDGSSISKQGRRHDEDNNAGDESIGCGMNDDCDEAVAWCSCVRSRQIIEAKAQAVEQIANGNDQGISFVT